MTNTGNQILTIIAISDDNDEEDANCPRDTLAIGAFMICIGSHDMTQDEIDDNGSPTPSSGNLSNTVTVSSDETDDALNSLNIPMAYGPSLSVVKSSTTAFVTGTGSVPYSYLVTNDGNVTLTDISLSDDNDENDMDCPETTLAPAASMTCTASHTVTQGEFDGNGSPTPDSGLLSNEVTASSNESDDAVDDLDIPIGELFFEGIPTLNQYGLAVLVLLMLGIGVIGFRRFS